MTLTGSLALGVDYADEQQVQATAIYLRNTEDDASLTLGNNFNFQQESGDQLRNYRIRFEERELEVLQFHGQHTLGPETLKLLDFVPMLSALEGLNVDWYYSDATATDGHSERNPVLGDRFRRSGHRGSAVLDPSARRRPRRSSALPSSKTP